ncbi:hypothetical protein U3A55_12390 [Salarchaeum sp. III]|uniref:hypothetical protein n=1 Tax=Salarchaeum sp. III TaxID=3107927 RepID=UPI002EDAA6D4
MAAADAIDWPAVQDTAYDLAPAPSWADTEAGALVWQLNGEHIRDAMTEALLDD